MPIVLVPEKITALLVGEDDLNNRSGVPSWDAACPASLAGDAPRAGSCLVVAEPTILENFLVHWCCVRLGSGMAWCRAVSLDFLLSMCPSKSEASAHAACWQTVHSTGQHEDSSAGDR